MDQKPDADYYFDSYAHYGIHESMLKDNVRTKSYMDSMYQNPHVFRGKVVLDVGTGTSILSMFAARAGAKKVYAVECSSIATQARAIVKENNLDGIITIVQGKLEDITIPEKVDIIVSEWMGYFLLYESMLNSVLDARKKFGAPGVRLFPDLATIFVVAIEDDDYWHRKVTFWNDLYGLNFSHIQRQSLLEPLVEIVDPKQIVSDVSTLVKFDLNVVDIPDLSFSSPFHLKFKRDDTVHAIAAHFDTAFTAHETVVLSTSPYTQSTHWKQTVFYLVEPIRVMKGEEMKGTITCLPNPQNHRDLDIRLTIDFKGAKHVCQVIQDYRLR